MEPVQAAKNPAGADVHHVEKAKLDDALSDLRNIMPDILPQLKGMTVDMGSEIEGQTKAMGDAEKDYDELNFRVKGAKTRARRLLGRKKA